MHFNIFFVNIQAEISKRYLSHTFQKMSTKGHDKYPVLPIKCIITPAEQSWLRVWLYGISHLQKLLDGVLCQLSFIF